MKIKILNRDVERVKISLFFSLKWVQPFSHNLLKLSGFLYAPNIKLRWWMSTHWFYAQENYIDFSITKEPGVFQHLSISLNFCAVIFLGLQLFFFLFVFADMSNLKLVLNKSGTKFVSSRKISKSKICYWNKWCWHFQKPPDLRGC